MDFELEQGTAVLTRTPATLRAMVSGLSDDWLRATEGGESWSPYDIVGHLVHGEKTDWIARARMIQEHGESRTFEPFDRFAQFRDSKGKSLSELLGEFESLRARNLETLAGWKLSAADLAFRGRHPEFGPVTLGQLLATWVVHDLGHIAQIARVMAKQYRDAIGPWIAYLPVVTR